MKEKFTTGQEFEFIKNKMIGYLTYKSLNSTISAMEESLNIKKQTKVLGMIKLKEKNSMIAYDTIKSIDIRKKVDLIDLIYAITFSVLALIALIAGGGVGSFFGLLAVAGVCLFTGYGTVIEIAHSAAEKPLIISSGGGEGEDEFIKVIS